MFARGPDARTAGRPSRAGGASSPSAVGDVGDVADGVDAGEAVDRQVRLDVDPAAAAGRAAHRHRRSMAADSPPPQTTVRVGIVVPSSSSTRSGCTDGDAGLEPDLGPLPGELLVRVGVRLLGEGPQQRRAAVDQGDPCPAVGCLPVAARALVSSASAPAVSTPVGPPPTTTTSSASSRAWASSPADSTSVLEVEAEPFGVGDRVQRERVLGSPGDAEELGPAARGQDQVRAADHGPVGQGQAAGAGVEPGHLGGADLDGRVVAEDRPVRPGDVLRR